MMSMDEWRKSPQSARNNPKLSPEKAQQIADEAIAGGQKWDVQEKINARRLADLNAECGGGLGKIQAPAKFDASTDWYELSTGAMHARVKAAAGAVTGRVAKPRCQAGAGAFGTYFVHPSEKYGVKLFRNGDEDDVGFEFDMLDRARAAGVNAPEPLSMNAVRDMDGGIRSQTLVLSHMKGYKELAKVYRNSYGNADVAPLITQVKIAREFRKLHTEGLAHGDIHSGNIMVNPVSKKPAIVDFGYATNLDSYHPGHGRSGIQNLMKDLNRLPEFFGLPARGDEFLARYKGVLDNIETQATNWDKGVERSKSWDRFELGVKRYHDALEAELLWVDRKPRSRFVSGADQPRIPGLTRRILTANANTFQREVMEQVGAQGDPSFFKQGAKKLGIKRERLFAALKPERDARLARQRQKPFGTPLPPVTRPSRTGKATRRQRFPDVTQKFNSAGVLRWATRGPKAPATPAPRSLGRLARSIMERSGNESMSLEAALRQARNEQRGFSSWKD
jgi:serine/threonine-protein kinase RIO1